MEFGGEKPSPLGKVAERKRGRKRCIPFRRNACGHRTLYRPLPSALRAATFPKGEGIGSAKLKFGINKRMSLRASAHTGVAIRSPHHVPITNALPRGYGLPRRFAPRNDILSWHPRHIPIYAYRLCSAKLVFRSVIPSPGGRWPSASEVG